ncbi:MAG: XDD4 family exosortase-dependent surface protein, partial [Planctomycetota bacterium]
MRTSLRWLVFCALSVGLAPLPAGATIVHDVSGVSSEGVAVSFEAQLTITGDNLTIVLINDSPVDSLNLADLLSSYYFDIVDALDNRPTLSYTSATGDVYLADKDAADTLQTAGADLRALAPGDNTWQYREMDPAFVPRLGFGVGTVGNSDLDPNNFQGNIVGAIDFSIYKGDITTQNLDGKLLVKETATFTLSGLTGFTEDDISRRAA